MLSKSHTLYHVAQLPLTRYKLIADRTCVGLGYVIASDVEVDGTPLTPDEMRYVCGFECDDNGVYVDTCENDWVESEQQIDKSQEIQAVVNKLLDHAINETALTSNILKSTVTAKQTQGLLSGDGAIVEVKPVAEWKAGE